MFNHTLLTLGLPPTLYKANISLIPKPGCNPQMVSSYCLISLLPIETKILGKIPANSLKECICSIIHPDETGFMPGRHMYFNLRRLFNILYAKHSGEAVVISLDAQCTFDQVEWPYMMSVLKKFGFGPSFMKWIEIIYSQPTASVITNQNISPQFAVHRGTHQGCPLSPFLFVIIIEPFAAIIRQSLLISPIDMFTSIHIISWLSLKSLAVWFSINWEKSELMPVSSAVIRHICNPCHLRNPTKLLHF